MNSSASRVMTFLPGVAIILPGEIDLCVIEREQAGIGDGDAMSVARKVSESLFGPREGALGVDDPIEAPRLGEMIGEGARL